jgi:hypothetical protein
LSPCNAPFEAVLARLCTGADLAHPIRRVHRAHLVASHDRSDLLTRQTCLLTLPRSPMPLVRLLSVKRRNAEGAKDLVQR